MCVRMPTKRMLSPSCSNRCYVRQQRLVRTSIIVYVQVLLCTHKYCHVVAAVVVSYIAVAVSFAVSFAVAVAVSVVFLNRYYATIFINNSSCSNERTPDDRSIRSTGAHILQFFSSSVAPFSFYNLLFPFIFFSP